MECGYLHVDVVVERAQHGLASGGRHAACAMKEAGAVCRTCTKREAAGAVFHTGELDEAHARRHQPVRHQVEEGDELREDDRLGRRVRLPN